MKKLTLIGAVILLLAASTGQAEDLQSGMPASDWSFEDSNGKVFTMESWAGKVLMVNYVDPDESDMNEHFTEAVKKAKVEGRLKGETYKGIGIADCAATWKPNVAIKMIAGKKAEKYKTVILFDEDGALRNAWGLKKDSANMILLDKKRVCRAIVRGRVPDDQVEKLVQLAVDLQKE